MPEFDPWNTELGTELISASDDMLAALAIAAVFLSTTILPRIMAARRWRRCKDAFKQAVVDENDMLAGFGGAGASIQRSRNRRRAGIRIHVWDHDGRIVGGWHPGIPSRAALDALLFAAAATLRDLAPEPEHEEPEETFEETPRRKTAAPGSPGTPRKPEPERPRQWWAILGVGEDATKVEIVSAWKTLARRNHPDLGGSTEEMAMINAARDEALSWRGR
jgi:hypothetical protein